MKLNSLKDLNCAASLLCVADNGGRPGLFLKTSCHEKFTIMNKVSVCNTSIIIGTYNIIN